MILYWYLFWVEFTFDCYNEGLDEVDLLPSILSIKKTRYVWWVDGLID